MLTIAICEDEKYILEELEKKVKRYIKRNQLDAVIQTYLSGEELLEKSDSFDIVLMDMKLPGISGLEAAKRLSTKKLYYFYNLLWGICAGCIQSGRCSLSA